MSIAISLEDGGMHAVGRSVRALQSEFSTNVVISIFAIVAPGVRLLQTFMCFVFISVPPFGGWAMAFIGSSSSGLQHQDQDWACAPMMPGSRQTPTVQAEEAVGGPQAAVRRQQSVSAAAAAAAVWPSRLNRSSFLRPIPAHCNGEVAGSKSRE